MSKVIFKEMEKHMFEGGKKCLLGQAEIADIE